MGEEQGQDGTDSKKVLDLESIEVWVMGRLVVVEHEVNDVPRGTDKEELECGEI